MEFDYSFFVVVVFYLASPLSHTHMFTPVLSFFVVFTCEPARRLPVASPPLQEKEVVASFRHPELEGVFQEHFLRVQPHIFQKGGTVQQGSLHCVGPCSGGSENLYGSLSSGSGEAWSILTTMSSQVSTWFSGPADSCRSRTSSPRFLTADLQQLYETVMRSSTKQDVSLGRWVTCS